MGLPRGALALLALALGCARASAFECEARVLTESGGSLIPAPGAAGECLPALYGPHVPFNADFDRPLVRPSPADGCSELSGAPLSGAIALFVLGACDAHDAALRAQVRGAVAALFATRAGQPFRRSTAGWLSAAPSLTIPVLLIEHAYEASVLTPTATHLRLRLAAHALRDGVPLSGALAAERDAFYTYELSARAELTVVVFAASGDPDLYGNRAPTLEAVPLPPGTFTAQYQAARPGDDLVSIASAEPGVYVFAVDSFSSAANYSIQLASGGAELALSAGQPMRVAIGRSESRYLKHTLTTGAGGEPPAIRFALTAVTGNVTLWVCTRFHAAPDGQSACAWTTSGGETPVVDIRPTDAHALRGCPTGCTYHLILRAAAAASVAVSVSHDGAPIALVDGAPQAGMVGPERHTSKYTFRTSDGAVELSATPTRGTMEVLVRAPTGAPPITIAAGSGGADGAVLRRSFAASELCADCDVEIEALALRGADGLFEPCVFAITASTPGGIVTLQDGTPRFGTVARGAYAHFRVRVEDAATDVRIIVTPISGNPDLFVSTTSARPNATHYERAADSAIGDDVVSMVHTDSALRGCADAAGGACVVYASVLGVSASTFTISALLSVANDGLGITKPEAARRDLTFSNAVFGMPLPFEAQSRHLAAVSPRDGCTGGASAGALAGALALVDRGACTFVQKVLRAQAAGAAGVVVANDEDGGPVRMGLPADWSGEEVRIPAVMVSRADGDALRALIASGAPVELVMRQPGDRPQLLLDGVPQEGHVEQSQMLFYEFYAHAGVGELRIAVTAEVGDPDLFVTNDGSPPTQTHHTWASTNSGEDGLTLTRASPAFCADCTYHIGVFGYSDASFSVIASSGDGTVLLQLGMPLTSHLRADEWAYFAVQLEDTSRALRIALTPLTGDPDLYVSTDGRPTRVSHEWAATAWGADTLVISPDAPGFRPGRFEIGVTAFLNSTFTITATLDGEEAQSNVLVAGRPQVVSVQPHEWQYFRFSVAPNATRVRFSATPAFGDPDLYVTTDGSQPTRQSHAYSANQMGIELIEATPADPAFCAGCIYRVGAFGFTGSNFTLIATADYAGESTVGGAPIVLTDGMPVEGLVAQDEVAYYRFFIDRTDVAVNVTLTAYSGDPDLYASFTDDRPTAERHEYTSSSLGGDTLSISRFSSSFCEAAACSLHIGVHGASEARFSIVVSQYDEVRLTLLDGFPQHAALSAESWQYYTFTLSHDATSVRFALSPSFGDPDLYVSTAHEPTRDSFEWRSSDVGADEVTIDRADPLWHPPPVTYRVGVYAWRGATNYTIVASSAFAQTLLEDGMPNRGSVAPGAYEYYKVYIDDNATDVEVIVTPLSGDPDLYASFRLLRPNASAHEFASTSAQRDVLSVEHAQPEMARCTASERRCTFYVAVYGAGAEASSFQIVAALHATNRGMRVTRPAAVARLYTNRAALFGPPLPFDGVEQRVVAATPADACAPITNGAELRGAIALVSRGECTFLNKTLHVQAAGASALVVANNVGTGILFMALNADALDDGARVTIPAVMVSEQDGAALRAALESSRVYALLEQHGDRPRRLVEGLPQFGRAILWEMVYYRFTVGDRHRDVTFTLTPSFGSADLLVRRADDGLPPTQSFYDLSSTLAGTLPDTVTIRTTDDAWCAGCTFLVGVLGWSPAEFTIVASTSETIIALQSGVPHLSHLDTEQRDFYRIDVTNPTHKLRVVLTPLNGDPDLYVSTVSRRPDEHNYTWSSTAFGGEVLTISHDDPNFRRGPFYIGVTAFENSTYTITALVDEDSCARLVGGQPQAGSLAAGDWGCYEVPVSERANRLTVSITPFFGDPDLYVTSDGTRPTSLNWHFRSSHVGSDEVSVQVGAGGAHACAGCTYTVGVYAFTATNFTLQATTSSNATDDESGAGGAEPRAHRVLADSLPTTSSVNAAQPAFFSYYLSHTSADVQLRFTRLSGSATLYASFADAYPNAAASQWRVAASALNTETGLTIGAADGRRCAPVPCVLYLAVETDGAATVSILAFEQSDDALLALIDGRPQQDSLEADGARFYAVAVPSNATSLTFTLTAFSGDPDLFVSNEPGVRPTFGRFTWGAMRLGSDSVRISSTDPRWCAAGCVFTAGVVALSASNFSLVASTGFAALPPIVLLQDGTPMQGDITQPGGYAFFRFPIDARDAAAVVTVTPFSGDPDLYASFNASRPQERTPEVFAARSLGGDTLRISHFDARFCPRGAAQPCDLFIGVHAFDGNCSFSVLASQANETAISLVDGVPQQASLERARWQYFTLAVGDDASRVSVSVTPSSGDPDIYVSASAAFPTISSYGWKSTLGGGDTVRIEPTDPDWCARCTYRIGVHAFSSTNFSIVGTTGALAVLLEDGVPRAASVGAGAYDYYRVLVEDVATDLIVVLTALSGRTELFVSHAHERPNATHHEFASSALEHAAISISHTDRAMAACTAGASRCAFYIGVHGVNASTYTLSARLSVATSGLRVDEPAEAAGGLVFTNAVFGPPLPFEGPSRPLALAAPYDGCAELTAGGLTDKVVLLERGGCFFTDKVRHAQAKGAAAAIVVNNADGPPVRMGAPNASAADAMRIPAVMVSRADGERLRALLAAGASVRATLQQPGDRPLLLVDGLPQRASVDAAQMLYFKFYATPDHPDADVTFTVTADFGDPDLYVSSDGLPPTQTHYDALASRFGADSLTLGPADAAHCTDCMYYVGVYGWSAANFTLVATSSTGVTTLQLGVPASGRLAAGERASYRLFVDDRSEALRIVLTPLTGDPDLYVSTSTQHPSAAEHTWASTRVGDDALFISASDPHFGAGVFFVGIVAASNTTYTLGATVSGEMRLVHGRPQRLSLPADEWQYLLFTLPADALAFTITVTAAFGDPDLYVRVGSRPTLIEHDFSATTSGGDTLTVRRDDAQWCAPPCTYYAGVYAWASTNFSVVAVVERGDESSGAECADSAMQLEDGVVVFAVTRANASRCFSLQIDEPDGSVTVTLTPFSGAPHLRAGFGSARASAAELRGVVDVVGGASGASVLLSPQCAASAQAGACTLHVRVSSGEDCTFSLAATQAASGRAISLVPGRPQYGSLAAGEWAYYSYATTADERAGVRRPALTLSLAAAFGDPNMYIRADSVLPTTSAFTWAATAAGGDHLLIGADDERACGSAPSCRFVIGVRAASATNFSITAYTHESTVTVQEGLPLTAVALAHACAEFTIRASGNPTELAVALTALSGEPTVFVGERAHPSAASHLPGGELRVAANSGELRVPLRAAGGGGAAPLSYFVSVCAGADGLPSRFVLSVRLRAGSVPLLMDGKPFATSVSDGRIEQFRIAVGPRASRMQVTASPRSGDLALLLSPRGSGHDAPGAGGSALGRALWRSSVPGVNAIVARSSDDGWCVSCEYAIGVLGQPSANFTLLVTLERAYTLRDGEPQVAQLLHYDGPLVQHAAYFAYSADEPVGFSIIVTVYTGSPEVFVSTSDPRPSVTSYEWQPAGAADSGGGGIREVTIGPSDPHFCSGCTYYVGVLSYENATVAVTASSERTRTLALVNGLPLKQSAVGGAYRYFTFEMGDDGGDLAIAVQPEAGDLDLDIFVTADGTQPSAGAHGWASGGARDGEDQVTVRRTDEGYCASCTYNIAVVGAHASTFTIVATSSSGTTLLPLGLPSQQRVPVGTTSFYKALLEPKGADAHLTLVTMRTALRVLLSTSTSQPLDDFSQAALDVPLGAPTRFVIDAPKLRQWCSPRVLVAGLCPLYIAVRSDAAEDASFSLSVSQGSAAVLIPGMPQVASADPAHPALFSISAGARADDDLALTISMQAPADARGDLWLELVVSTRGFLPDEDEPRTWRARADNSRGGTASVLIQRGTAGACVTSPCTYHVTVIASAHIDFTVIASAEHGHTLLVEGGVVHSAVAQGESALFKTYVNRAAGRPLVLTVHPCGGNPDLYVSDVALRPGPPAAFTFASAQMDQSERVRLSPDALSKLGPVLYISVFGQTATNFTISAASNADDEHPSSEHAGGAGGQLQLIAFGARKAQLSWHVARASAADAPNGAPAAAAAAELDAEIEYAVQLADDGAESGSAEAARAVLYTLCGLEQSAHVVATRIQRDADRTGTITVTLNDLQPARAYQVNVLATRKGTGMPLLFRPLSFATPAHAALGGGVIAAIVLGALLGGVLLCLALVIARRRKQLASLSLLRRDEAVDMYHLGDGGQLQSIGPLVASPLFGGAASANGGGAAPLAPYPGHYEPSRGEEGIGDMLAASLDLPVHSIEPAPELESRAALASDASAPTSGHAASHRPAAATAAMDSESESDGGDEEQGGNDGNDVEGGRPPARMAR